MSYKPKSFNKLFASSITVAVVASSVAPAASLADNKFSDVDSNAWYAEAVNSLADRGVITGNGNGVFNPYGNVNRAETAKMIALAIGLDVDNAPDVNFKDVSKDAWYYKYVAALVEADIISGYDDNTFKPNRSINRAEMAKIIAEAYNVEANENLDTTFTDLNAIPWAEGYIKALSNAGIVSGKTATTYAPTKTVSRLEAAAFIFKSENTQEENADTTAPVLSVNEEAVAVTDAAAYTLTGTVEAGSTVTVNNEEVTVAADGTFSYETTLEKGENSFAVVATDAAGNMSTAFKVVTLSYTSGIAGFVFDTGSAVEGVTVTVGDESATTDANGYFELLNVAPGTVEATIIADGYETVTVSDVDVLAGKVSTFTEDIASGEINTSAITVSGVIVDDATGAPLNADVTLESFDSETDSWVEVATVTAISGAYTIDQTDADPDFELGAEYRQTVSLENYHEFAQTITLDNQEVVNSLEGIKLSEIAAMDLTGTVTDAAGDAVNNATVKIFDAEGVQVGTDLTTDAEGAYNATDLQLVSGTYNVVIDDSTSAVSYTEFEVIEGIDAIHNVQLEEGNAIDVTIGTESLSDVFGDGAADTATYTLEIVNGNTVIDSVDFVSSTGSDSTMSFGFTRVAPGEYTLKLSGDYVVEENFAITVDGDETLEERAVPAGTLTGLVDDGTDGIEAATVTLLDGSNNIVDTTETDVDGNYTFTSLVAGDYTAEVSAAGFVDGSLDAKTVSKNTATTADTITLSAVETTGDVAGFVRVSGSLAPVEGATVVYYDEDGEEVDNDTVAADGSYSLTGLTAGTYDVVIRDAGVETFATTQTIEAGDDLTSVNYNLTSGGNASLEISVVDSEGNPVDVAVNGFDIADGYADPTSPVFGVWEEGSTTTDTITFADLSAGTYDVSIDVDSADYVDVETTATVAKGETGELVIVVDEVASQNSVNFLVIDETNTNVTGAHVVVFNEDGSIKTVLETTSGTADLNLVDGNYTLAVINDGYVVEKRALTVAGETVNIPVIQLSPIN